MFCRIFIALIILTALVVGCFAMTLPREEIVRLIIFRDFFDVSLPILAFGALIKYLITCNTNVRTKCCDKSNCNCNCGCCDKNGTKTTTL